jgi:hypothetical protein
VPSLHAAYKTVKSFFYAHSIGEHYEQVILNLELALFHLKHKVSTKQLPITDFFEKSDFHTGNIFFVGPRRKCTIFIFCCILVSLTHLMLSRTVVFPRSFFLALPSEMMNKGFTVLKICYSLSIIHTE